MSVLNGPLFTAFDGLPRRYPAMLVRADFLRQVQVSDSHRRP